MIGARRRSWPDFSPCNSTTNCVANAVDDDPQLLSNSSPKTNTNSEIVSFVGKKRDSVGSCPAWSLNSFMEMIPSSPSPKCSPFSSYSPASDFFYSQISSTVFSSPRNKDFLSSGKISPEYIEEIEEVNNLLTFYMQNRDFNEEQVVKEESNPTPTKCLSYYSTEYKSCDGCQPLVVLPLQLPGVVNEGGEEEERGVGEGEIEDMTDNGVSSNSSEEDSGITESPASINAHHRLIGRPKPYHAFLNEIKKKWHEDEINAWKEAKHLKLMNKLRRREAAISAWELKQTKKATLQMKKIECKLERQRAKAMKEMQKKIDNTQRKAEEKKVKERHSTVNKMSKISKVAENIKATHSRICLKFICFF